MSRIAWLFLLVLCLAVFVCAQNSSGAQEMNGTICDSQCVVQQGGLATCDLTCTEKSGEAVFVGDNGTVMQVANQDMCKSHMGQHVKMTAKHVDAPAERQREQWIEILSWNSPGG